jgi:hypothetical protein
MAFRLDAAARLLDDAVHERQLDPEISTGGALQLLHAARCWRLLIEPC